MRTFHLNSKEKHRRFEQYKTNLLLISWVQGASDGVGPHVKGDVVRFLFRPKRPGRAGGMRRLHRRPLGLADEACAPYRSIVFRPKKVTSMTLFLSLDPTLLVDKSLCSTSAK